MTKKYRPQTLVKMLGIAALLAVTPFTNLQAATINMSSIETSLAEPDNHNAMHIALWSGFMTQIFEYNMPFIELSLAADDEALTEFRMTIGDTDYNFSNEFKNRHLTNSAPIADSCGSCGSAAENTGSAYALHGRSTPDVDFTSSIDDGGDTLVLNFGSGGLQPGQTVRFQVDINADAGSVGTMMFQDYSHVFFTANGGSESSDTVDNSMIMLGFVDDSNARVVLPNYGMDGSNMVSLSNPRPYSQMQGIDLQGDLEIGGGVPEPTTAALALIAGAMGLATRRRIVS